MSQYHHVEKGKTNVSQAARPCQTTELMEKDRSGNAASAWIN